MGKRMKCVPKYVPLSVLVLGGAGLINPSSGVFRLSSSTLIMLSAFAFHSNEAAEGPVDLDGASHWTPLSDDIAGD